MYAYIIRRLLLIIPTLFLVTVIIFLTIRLIPGDIIDQMVAEAESSSSGEGRVDRAAFEKLLGLDVPIHVQYGRWVGNIILHGDLGTALWRQRNVRDEIFSRFPITLELGLLALIVAMIIAVPIGIYSGIRQDTVGDYVARSFAIACIALPSFWLGTLVMVYPSIWWGWSPSMEIIRITENPIGNLVQFIVPASILGMVLSGTSMRMTRTMMLEVLRQDYVRTAWSKGLSEKAVILRHAMKNALIPVVTIIGLQVPILIGGSVILEQIFVLPGMGLLLLEAINHRDYTLLSGINVVMATIVLVINLLVDITYSSLDPRVHFR